MSRDWPQVSCLQVPTCLFWSFQQANGNQFCIFKARWWDFRVPLTSNKRELVQLYSSQMPVHLYISTVPLVSGKRGKGEISSLHIIALINLKHNPASLKTGLKQWQLNTCAICPLPQEQGIYVRFGWAKRKAGKRFSSSDRGGQMALSWAVNITACPALFRHCFTQAQAYVSLINENILCVPSLAKVGFGVKEISFAYSACFASIPQLPEISRERSTEWNVISKRNTMFFKMSSQQQS